MWREDCPKRKHKYVYVTVLSLQGEDFTLKVTDYSKKLSVRYIVTTKSCNASLFCESVCPQSRALCRINILPVTTLGKNLMIHVYNFGRPFFCYAILFYLYAITQQQ